MKSYTIKCKCVACGKVTLQESLEQASIRYWFCGCSPKVNTN